MKFTRYLEDTQTPEWKRAYIDYRIFKERIRAIRRVQDGMALPVDSYSNSQLNHQAGSMLSVIVQSESEENSSPTSSVNWPERDRSPSPPRVRTEGRGRPLLERRPPLHGTRTPQNDAPPSPGGLAPPNPSRPVFERRLSLHRTHTSQSNVTPPSPGGAAAPNTSRPPIERRISLDPTPSPPSPGGVAATTMARRPKITLPQLIVRQPTNRSSITRQWTNNSMARQGDTIPPSPAIPPLTPASRVFKGLSHLIGPSRHPYSELSLHALIPLLSPQELAFFAALDSELQKVETFYVDRENAMKIRTRDLEVQLRELNEHRRLFDAAHPETLGPHIFNATRILGFLRRLPFVGAEKPAVDCVQVESETIDVPSGHKMDEKQAETGRGQEHLDPKAYLYARRKLKKAVLEHYRGLEMLHNYRVLNIYGFRRVLNKFEKATKIPAQRAYMEEKVEKSAFSSDETLRTMMEDMQNVFAASFASGDRKKAITRLRAGPQYKSHHNSTFCSGLAIGSAVAAFSSGVAHIFQQSTRDEIPAWDGLLFIYGVLAIPVIFALLVGLNLLVWARARINWVFIFELDLRTRLDHREYFQTPSVLLAALCYAFWLSFARIGYPEVSPTMWPLVWLAFAAVVMFDPFPILFKPSRFWLIKNVGKLLKSGTRRVEFTDFWMGDQFCSLGFTLSNLTLIGCVYSRGLNPEWRTCGSASHLWPLIFVLGALPFLVRLVQSIKRWVDSRLNTHLINAGKYGAGIVSQLCYVIWRHRGGHYDSTFVLWCISNAISTTYALIWDFLMDWSILRPHSQHFLLRQQLVYTNHIFLYYVAIVTNTLIRFLWVFYIPAQGPDFMLRTWILGFLEVLRRWQWNFYRLENEHLGNADKYRVTREVPLPYTLPYEVRADLEEEIPERL